MVPLGHMVQHKFINFLHKFTLAVGLTLIEVKLPQKLIQRRILILSSLDIRCGPLMDLDQKNEVSVSYSS